MFNKMMTASGGEETNFHLKNRYKSFLKNLIRDRQLYLLLLPVMAYYILFVYLPLVGVQIAFKEYNIFKGMAESPWIGFEHFRKFFTGPFFFRTLKNTFAISLYGLVFGFPVPIVLALLFNEVKKESFKKTVQTLTYLPYFISVVVVAGMVVNFLSPGYGIINRIVEAFGGEKIYFLTKPEYFVPIFTLMNIWQLSGFGAIVYIASLSGIDTQLYEAASIDGAGRWKQLLHVTLPSILPTIVVMLILRVGQMMNVGYEAIILLYQPATYETADVISTYVYREGIMGADYGLATAVDLFNSIVALILVFGANKLSNKITQNGIW